MIQTQRLLWLIKYLIGEEPRYSKIQIPEDENELFNLYRSLVNVRMPYPISEEYLKVEDEFLQERNKNNKLTSVKDLTPVGEGLYIFKGDITSLKCDAIVNAGNSQLLGCFCPCHACIDNCIHTFSGVRLRLACNELMKKQGFEEPTGSAKITPAFNLPSKFVLHTVGPIITGSLTKRDCEMLASCYRSCLELAVKNELKSIAFCCISTGEFHFPNDIASKIAVETVKAFKEKSGSDIEVIFNVFKPCDYKLYTELFKSNK